MDELKLKARAMKRLKNESFEGSIIRNKTKKLLGVAFILVLSLSSASTTFASDKGENIKQASFVPLRTTMEAMGVESIEWIPDIQGTRFSWNGSLYTVFIGQQELLKDGQAVGLSDQPFVQNQITMVPTDLFETMENHEMEPDLAAITPISKVDVETKSMSIREEITATAKQFIGVPYVWGGMSPKGFDSSGFVGYVFKQNGINIPRVSFDIYEEGKQVSLNELQPGELIFFEGYKDGPSHGTIYIGIMKSFTRLDKENRYPSRSGWGIPIGKRTFMES